MDSKLLVCRLECFFLALFFAGLDIVVTIYHGPTEVDILCKIMAFTFALAFGWLLGDKREISDE